MEWKNIIKSIAPTIGLALGGPLAGMAIKSISDHLLGGQSATESDIRNLIENDLNPEKLAKLKELDNEFSVKMKALDIDLYSLQLKEKELYVSDTQDARRYKDNKVFWLGVIILVSFVLVMAVALIGSYALLTDGLPVKDASVIGMVSGFVGTIIGYVAANAQQVVGFFFGSSAGSSKKSEAINDAFSHLTDKIK